MNSFKEKVKKKCKDFWLGSGARKGWGAQPEQKMSSLQEKVNRICKYFWLESGPEGGGTAAGAENEQF